MKKYSPKLNFLILSIFCLTVLNGCFNSSESNPKAEAEALKDVESWLAIMDSLKFVEAFRQTAKIVQNESSEEEWEFAFNEMNKLIGRAFLRKVRDKQFFRELLGLPKGEYVVIVFLTTFTKRKETLETVMLTKEEDGKWRVFNYHIK